MLLIAICDDEQYYRDYIQKLLTQYCAEHRLEYKIDHFQSGEAFLAQGDNTTKYDIVFMDINMDEIDGIQTAMQIRNFHSNTHIVFVTAFINYVLEGYKVSAIRYIMKDTLQTAVPECMDAILDKMQLRQVTFTFVEGEKVLYTDNIIYIESQKHKSIFHYAGRELFHYQIYEKLDCIEEELARYGFLRIHKSYLVNMNHIRKINNYQVTLDNAEQLPAARLRYQAVKEAFVLHKGALS